MFWKNVHKDHKSWSIVKRLGLLYAISTFALLCLSAGFLYWHLISHINGVNNDFLINQLQIIREIAEKNPGKIEPLRQEIVWEPSTSQYPYSARMINKKGKTFLETPNMSRFLPAKLFPQPSLTSNEPTDIKIIRADNKHYYRLIAQRQNLNGRWYLVQTALDVSHEIRLIDNYRLYLWLVLSLGVVLSFILGVVIARQGLKPLLVMRRDIKKINPDRLHQRFDVSHIPTELVSLSAELNSMLTRIEDAFKRLTQFSADLAHELRTPINNLMGEAEIALSRSRTVEEYREILHSSLEEYTRLSQLIDGILFLARADNPKTAIKRYNLHVHAELKAVKEFYEALAEEKKIKITCQGDAELFADPMLFRRAISNLLSNAIKYSLPGGEVTLSVEKMPKGDVRILVIDNGVGIPVEHLAKIFDRFYRVDSARTKMSGGTGLGLALVKSIMDLHRGSVAVQSAPEKGTRFMLIFPPHEKS